MNIQQALALLGMLTETVVAQQQQIETLQTELQRRPTVSESPREVADDDPGV